MNDAAMQEDRGDEAKPLVWLSHRRAVREGCDAHAEAAEIVQCAEANVADRVRCRVGTWPWQVGFANVCAIDDECSHARDVAGAHVYQDVRRRTDHGVEGWMNLNR